MANTTSDQKLQQTSDELGTEAQTLLPKELHKERLKITQRNFVLVVTDTGGSNSLLLGHPTNGIMGVATGLGGSQIVMGSTSGSVTTEVIRRRYDWDKKDELDKGAKSPNVDTDQGFIQLGNVTIKKISLEHKENKNN